ncbi:MAG: hypothetical protein Q4G27_07170 [Flavobacteriaceae bacterium]|nr:hypothetical protein [Flavobacteriaceae bacterium]
MKRFLSLIMLGMFLISCSSDDLDTQKNNICEDVSEIVSDEFFQLIETTNYHITDLEISDNCLRISVSSSGCDPTNWNMKLFSTNSFYTVQPYERILKIELNNNQSCLAVFEKSVSFDLIPYQIQGQSETPLHIVGWNEPIIYRY